MSRTLVLSRHVAFLPLGNGLFVCGHAFAGPRTVVDEEHRAMLLSFRVPADPGEWVQRASDEPGRREVLRVRLEVMCRQGILVEDQAAEDVRLAAEFGARAGGARAAVRRYLMRHAPDARVRRAAEPPSVAASRDAWKVVYLGNCLALPAMEALTHLAAEAGYDVDAVGSFPEDVGLVAERRPDFVVVGDLPRVGLGYRDARPTQYVEALRVLCHNVRRVSEATLLVHNLPGPTCSTGGLSERGDDTHVNKVRRINVGIAALAAELDDCHVVDVDQALSLAGRRGLVDDAVVSQHHLGSLTWLAERAARQPAPTATPVAELLRDASGRGPLAAEATIAAEDLRVMLSLRGSSRRKCVIVDLDDTLWPGVLAETGAPFPADLAVDVYPHGLYLGLHEALLALRDRGILIAAVSKNDESVVRELWRYPPAFDALPRLLREDFATVRVNWRDKVDNILDIAAELGLAPGTVAYIDDSPYERERVRARLPEVLVLGDNLFDVRWQLLTDPAFQVPRVTPEASRRHELVGAQLARERARASATDEREFLASLGTVCTLRRETDERNLARVAELIARTTQLNTTGERPSLAELRARQLYTLSARDRFADHGLVGVCIVEGDLILQVVMSCRVLGLGLEQTFLRGVALELAAHGGSSVIRGRYTPTSRNQPARRLFADAGFVAAPDDEGLWSAEISELAARPPGPHALTTEAS